MYHSTLVPNAHVSAYPSAHVSAHPSAHVLAYPSADVLGVTGKPMTDIQVLDPAPPSTNQPYSDGIHRQKT